MPKTVIIPPGTQTPIAPFSPGTLADGVVYVSPLDHGTEVGDPHGRVRPRIRYCTGVYGEGPGRIGLAIVCAHDVRDDVLRRLATAGEREARVIGEIERGDQVVRYRGRA